MSKRADYFWLRWSCVSLLLTFPTVAAAAGTAPDPLRLEARATSSPVQDDGDEKVAKSLEVGKSRLEFYGFVRLDAIFDDSRPNHPQFPSFILSEDPQVGPRDNSSSNLHPRLTRFGFNLKSSKIDGLGGSLTGKVEIDFQNGGSESRQAVRLRHGFLQLKWDRWSLLAGQTWDAFSPLYPTVNSDSLMWNAGNLGDRRPQLRFAYASEEATFSFVGGLGLTGAIDSQDLDGDGIRDGDDAALPNLQTRIGISGPGGKGWALGLSGHYGEEETQSPIAGQSNFASYSANLDYRFDLSAAVSLKGEIWTGQDLSDFRGGIGQGVNTVTGEEIESAGGWAELGFKVTKVYGLYLGYTLDNPRDGDVPSGGRIENRAVYLVNRFRFDPFLLGIDYLNWRTEYRDLDAGEDNRFNLYLAYNF